MIFVEPISSKNPTEDCNSEANLASMKELDPYFVNIQRSVRAEAPKLT